MLPFLLILVGLLWLAITAFMLKVLDVLLLFCFFRYSILLTPFLILVFFRITSSHYILRLVFCLLRFRCSPKYWYCYILIFLPCHLQSVLQFFILLNGPHRTGNWFHTFISSAPVSFLTEHMIAIFWRPVFAPTAISLYPFVPCCLSLIFYIQIFSALYPLSCPVVP